jgi:hypothetical protein
LALAGYFLPEREPPNWECTQHHRWQHGSDTARAANLLEILKAYGFVDSNDE